MATPLGICQARKSLFRTVLYLVGLGQGLPSFFSMLTYVSCIYMLYCFPFVYIVVLRAALLCIPITQKALCLTHYQDKPEPAHNLRRVFRNAWPLAHGPMLSG